MPQNVSDSGSERSGNFQEIVDGFLLQPGLPFAEVVTAEKIDDIFRKHGDRQRRRTTSGRSLAVEETSCETYRWLHNHDARYGTESGRIPAPANSEERRQTVHRPKRRNSVAGDRDSDGRRFRSI